MGTSDETLMSLCLEVNDELNKVFLTNYLFMLFLIKRPWKDTKILKIIENPLILEELNLQVHIQAILTHLPLKIMKILLHFLVVSINLPQTKNQSQFLNLFIRIQNHQ